MIYKILIGICWLTNIYAQNMTIKGTVIDAKSGEMLAAASLQIVDTYHGTITNEYGEFILEIENFPAELEISFIGYAKKRITVKEYQDAPLKILMTPVVFEMEAIVVTAENPAMNIMRKVIANKLKWRAKLETYKVDAYSRVQLANDSSIVSVAESFSEAYWDKERGPREIIKSKRQTENINSSQNFAFSSFIANFYDDDIDIMGYKVVGPTHPDAFDYYEFKLIDRKAFGTDTVFVIELVPIAALNPTFVGTVSVLDKAFALIAVDVKPNAKTFFFPMPIEEWNVSYKQQFRNFGKEFWLPVDVRAAGDVKIGMPGLDFPLIKYSRAVRLTDYQVNIELPDTLYEDEKIIRSDSVAIVQDSLFTRRIDIIPLTQEEEVAYLEIDSTDTFQKAFRPSGLLADMLIEEDEEQGAAKMTIGGRIVSTFSPDLNYNRVEQGHIGVTFEDTYFKRYTLSAGLAYKMATKNFGYNGGLKIGLGKRQHTSIAAEYFQGSATTYKSETYPALLSGVATFLGADDYFDYYWTKSFQINLTRRLRSLNINVSLGINLEKQQSLRGDVSDYNILGRDISQRPNPRIDAGDLTSLKLKLSWGDDDFVPFGLHGQQRVQLNIDYSNPDLINSDFSFTRYDLSADWNFRTFLKRRFLPNTLSLHLSAGYAKGSVPLQKLGILDASYHGFTPFATFKTLRGLPYVGEKHIGLFWEHNFRSVPFEMIGLRWFAEKNIGIIVHGAHGRSWLSAENKAKFNYAYRVPKKVHNEWGFSVNGILSFFRLDVSWRFDRPTTYLGISALRWF